MFKASRCTARRPLRHALSNNYRWQFITINASVDGSRTAWPVCARVLSLLSSLRNCRSGRLLLPTTDTVTVGRHGFYYAGPATWKELPATTHDWHVNVTVQLSETVGDTSVSLTVSLLNMIFGSCAISAHLRRFFRLICAFNFRLIIIINNNNNYKPKHISADEMYSTIIV